MADFERRLRAYLDAVQRGAAPERVRHRQVDAAAVRRYVLDRLAAFAAAPDADADEVQQRYREWTERLPRLIEFVETRASTEFPRDPTLATSSAIAIIESEFAPNRNTIEGLEAARMLNELLVGLELADYALEVRLTIPRRNGVVLTRLGDTFMQLRGKDARRWLLTLETIQNVGYHDTWRISTQLLVDAMPPLGLSLDDLNHGYLKYTKDVVGHADDMGLLTLDDPEAGDASFVIVPAMRDVVAAVIDEGPWHAAVRAMLDDERARVVPALGTTSAIDATVEQTRMITHEVRNALVPVRGNLDALLGVVDEATRDRVERARVGVVRVLSFVDQLVTVAELVSEPSTEADVEGVAREAIEHLDALDRVELASPSTAVSVRAPRSKLVMTLGNVIRNALQAADASARVRVRWSQAPEAVTIEVDDGGPGVAARDRVRIFDDGFTTRPGGSGFGLAFARRFVEGTLRGTIRCEDSDLGGARFVISIPIQSSP